MKHNLSSAGPPARHRISVTGAPEPAEPVRIVVAPSRASSAEQPRLALAPYPSLLAQAIHIPNQPWPRVRRRWPAVPTMQLRATANRRSMLRWLRNAGLSDGDRTP